MREKESLSELLFYIENFSQVPVIFPYICSELNYLGYKDFPLNSKVIFLTALKSIEISLVSSMQTLLLLLYKNKNVSEGKKFHDVYRFVARLGMGVWKTCILVRYSRTWARDVSDLKVP